MHYARSGGRPRPQYRTIERVVLDPARPISAVGAQPEKGRDWKPSCPFPLLKKDEDPEVFSMDEQKLFRVDEGPLEIFVELAPRAALLHESGRTFAFPLGPKARQRCQINFVQDL